MEVASIDCPAKINLFLLVTGRRPDGYHDLLSLVVPIPLRDSLSLHLLDGADDDRLSVPGQPHLENHDNLVCKALGLMRARTRLPRGLHFVLQKRIPLGAGLGGGSSDAVGALRLLNKIADPPLSDARLHAAASELGSDCPLFLRSGPVILRGRGEIVEDLPPPLHPWWQGRRCVILKPSFGIETKWAFSRLASSGERLVAPALAERQLHAFLAAGAPPLTFPNSFLALVEEKFLTHVIMRDKAHQNATPWGLSGSGSACFAFPPTPEAEEALLAHALDAWGPPGFAHACTLDQC